MGNVPGVDGARRVTEPVGPAVLRSPEPAAAGRSVPLAASGVRIACLAPTPRRSVAAEAESPRLGSARIRERNASVAAVSTVSVSRSTTTPYASRACSTVQKSSSTSSSTCCAGRSSGSPYPPPHGP